MGEVLLAMFGPTVVFGLFALLAVKFGAESRPYFDERPVVDDRPKWFPIARSGSDDEDDEDDEPPDDGETEDAPEGGAGGRGRGGGRAGAARSAGGAARVREERVDEPVRRVIARLDVGG